MKKPCLKSMLSVLAIALVLTSCGPALKVAKMQPDKQDVSSMPEKKAELTEAQQKLWPYMDMIADTVPGMSVRKAYADIIKKNKGETVIVAVLDAGVDIEHEDLKDIIWTNKDEVPNNGIDDDHNGYVDDVHGWNFLGDMVHGTLNFTRIVRKFKPEFEGKSADEISPENKADFELYQKAHNVWEQKHSQAERTVGFYKRLQKQLTSAIKTVEEKMGGKDFTRTELSEMEASSPEAMQAKTVVLAIMKRADLDNGKKLDKVLESIGKGLDYFQGQLDYHLNLDYHGRKLVGDDSNDLHDTDYGNGDVDGPTKDKEDVMHGTHVAGIIAAVRNNGIGMNGVANNVKIMAIRAVPDGDEFDKDIALGIRYAVDNGAKIINMSFGKSFSSHPDWVIDAMKYAAKHDVLLVHAAGNDGASLEEERNYPNDQWPGHESEITDNLITVGALNYVYGKGLVAGFSNYGKTNVDVFAPGVQVWSTVPLDKYKFLQGTSMASPEVAGVAAVIRSYFPKLTAPQVKQVIMKSGLTTDIQVSIPGEKDTEPFDELSKSGRMVNLYNALIYASRMSKK